MKRFVLLLPSAALAACLGCGEGGAPQNDRVLRDVPQTGRVAEAPGAPPAGAAQDKAPVAEGQPRKIICNARAELVVDDFDKAQEQLAQLVQEHKGYVAKSDAHDAPVAPRSGEWTLRVPADQFRDLLAGLGKLGELRESQTDSDDITDRYYDLKAHIKNDQAEEEALRKLLVEKSATGKLEDLLAVRRELRELRGQIDVRQGQMERWDKEVAMTTVVVQIQNRKDYVPAASPSFGSSIARTFGDSVGALLACGQGAVLVVVASAPWLAVLAVPALGVWWAIRNRIKLARGQAQTSPPAAP